jgi:hypothetical protein
MDSYLISYEYKEKDGCLINTKITSEAVPEHALEATLDLLKAKSYDGYLKILFCQKL